jgi:hypothetical protein
METPENNKLAQNSRIVLSATSGGTIPSGLAILSHLAAAT